jgi:transposase-like protein
MPTKKYKPEQIMALLRQVEVAIANGQTTPQACREAGISEQTFYRWRKEYGGLKLDPAKRLKALEQENAKLKRLVAELSLEKQILQDVRRVDEDALTTAIIALAGQYGRYGYCRVTALLNPGGCRWPAP